MPLCHSRTAASCPRSRSPVRQTRRFPAPGPRGFMPVFCRMPGRPAFPSRRDILWRLLSPFFFPVFPSRRLLWPNRSLSAPGLWPKPSSWGCVFSALWLPRTAFPPAGFQASARGISLPILLALPAAYAACLLVHAGTGACRPPAVLVSQETRTAGTLFTPKPASRQRRFSLASCLWAFPQFSILFVQRTQEGHAPALQEAGQVSEVAALRRDGIGADVARIQADACQNVRDHGLGVSRQEPESQRCNISLSVAKPQFFI